MGKVIVQDFTCKEPITMIGTEAGVCWGADISDQKKNYRRGIDCLESEHGRTFEFPDAYMILDGYSARVIREWYTHIGGSPTRLQASTRYIDYEHGFDYVVPPSIEKDEAASAGYKKVMTILQNALTALDAFGVPREDTALLLPLGMTTRIVCKHNARNLMDMSHQRMCSRAYHEYRKLFDDVCNALRAYSEEWAYLYTGNKAAKRKSISLDGHVLVLAPHAGCIDADTWIRCRRKCLNVRQIAKPVKAKNTWLAGKIKCIDCGHALSLKSYPRKRSADARYYICNSKYVSASCDGVGAIQAAGIEDIVFDEMSRKLKEFNKLSYKEKHGDPIELTKLKIRAEEIEKEIATLIDKIVSASTATMEYINERIDALDEEKKTVKEKIAQMSAEMYDRQNIGVISDYMSKWNDISIDDKLTVVDTLIESIHVGHGKVKIAWKI